MSPLAGTFTLTYSGQTTSALAYNASAATVEAALVALSNIGSGDVAVTKIVDTLGAQEWRVTFGGSLAATNVSQTTIDTTNVMMNMGLSETETTVTNGSAVSEAQVVTLNGSPTGGTFRLEFGGQQTSTIAYNASTGTVDSTLEALSTIDTVTVSGSAGGPYTITFTGTHAGVNVAPLEVQTADLTNANLLLTVSRSAYDAASRLVSVTDALDNVTEYD